MPTGDENGNEADRDLFNCGLTELAGFLGKFFRRSGLPRRLILFFSWLVLVIIGIASGLWAYSDWTQLRPKIGPTDKFAIATLAIAFFAAVFALLAYQVSTGPPDLELGIMLYRQDPRKYDLKYMTDSERRGKLRAWFKSRGPSSEDPKFLWDDPRESLWDDLKASTHIAYMWIDNKSRYPAKSPAVIIRFGEDDDSSMGLCWTQPECYNLDEPWKDRSQGPTWKGTHFKTSGMVVLAAQWDGGSEYTIHGKSTRRIPDLPLVTLFSERPKSEFKVELLAENYRKAVKVAIEFKED